MDALAPLPQVLAQSAGDQRFRTILLSTFAILGLLLATIGLYGVTSAAVTARTWEVGVRLALGATSGSVIRNVMNESARQVFTGVAAGLALFFLLVRLAEGLLYGTAAADPAILFPAVAPLLLVTFAVSYAQARRLGKVNPVMALRGE